MDGRGWCRKHYGLWRRHGDPLWVRHCLTTEERYRAKFVRGGPDDCWPWTASLLKDGYGKFGLSHGVTEAAHRYGWELLNGPIPPGMFVCHHCDNPPCQNPAHWFLDTPKGNTHDMMRKGRAKFVGDGNGTRSRDTMGRYV